MIKLFSLKQEKEKEAAAASSGDKKVAPGLIRMQKGACTTSHLTPRAVAALLAVAALTRCRRPCALARSRLRCCVIVCQPKRARELPLPSEQRSDLTRVSAPCACAQT